MAALITITVEITFIQMIVILRTKLQWGSSQCYANIAVTDRLRLSAYGEYQRMWSGVKHWWWTDEEAVLLATTVLFLHRGEKKVLFLHYQLKLGRYIKKNEIMQLTGQWMELEIIMLNKIRQTQKDILYMCFPSQGKSRPKKGMTWL
jgi:hypothetical protein